MLKKLIPALLAAVLLLTAVPFVACGASDTQVDVYEGGQKVRSVIFIVGVKQYFVNGQTPGVQMDAAPYIDQGRTFVPIRYLAYGLGVAENDVGWEEKARKVTLKLGNNSAELVVGSKIMKANGQARTMDVAPQLKSGRTYLPARYVAEGLGYQVDWDPEDRLVICWPAGEQKPVGDMGAVKEYMGAQLKPKPQPAENAGLPENAVQVTSLDQLKAPVVHIDSWYMNYEKVYQAEVTTADFPVVCDALGYVYKLEIDRSKFIQYDQPAVKVTVDNEQTPTLVIIANGGKDVRYRQVDTHERTADGKYVLNFWANRLYEKLDGDPLLRPEDVEWFGLSTAGLNRDGQSLVLWIKNPYKSN